MTAIVTGASRGIGAAIAKVLANDGFSIIVNYSSDRAGALEVVAELESTGARAIAVQADVASEPDVLRLFETAERELGPITALVNNAAIVGGVSLVADLPAATLERVLAVNVTGTILCAREAVRRMSTLRGGKGGGIVNISSRAAIYGGAGESVHYSASKGAVNSFTIGLAREVATEGIRVNAVSPGLIATGLHAAMGVPDRVERMMPTIPMRRAGTSEEVAEGVRWLLSGAASYLTGTILDIGGGR